ncbi:MAG: hypothetical protein WAT91_18100, partial [Saprospiraceae bacterium]
MKSIKLHYRLFLHLILITSIGADNVWSIFIQGKALNTPGRRSTDAQHDKSWMSVNRRPTRQKLDVGQP